MKSEINDKTNKYSELDYNSIINDNSNANQFMILNSNEKSKKYSDLTNKNMNENDLLLLIKQKQEIIDSLLLQINENNNENESYNNTIEMKYQTDDMLPVTPSDKQTDKHTLNSYKQQIPVKNFNPLKFNTNLQIDTQTNTQHSIIHNKNHINFIEILNEKPKISGYVYLLLLISILFSGWILAKLLNNLGIKQIKGYNSNNDLFTIEKSYNSKDSAYTV